MIIKHPIKKIFFLFVATLFFINYAIANIIELTDSEALGSVVIDDSAIRSLNIKPYTLLINNTPIQINKSYRFEAEKTHTLILMHDKFNSEFKFILKAKEQKTIKLSALKLDWDQSLLEVNIGPTTKIQLTNKNLNLELSDSWSKFLNPPIYSVFSTTETNYEYMAVFPGQYKITGLNVTHLPTVNFIVKEGSKKVFKYKFKDPRSTLSLNSAPKHLKDMFKLEQKNNHIFLVYRDSTKNNSPTVHNDYRMPFSLESCPGCQDYRMPLSNIEFISLQPWDKIKYIPYFDSKYIQLELVVNNTWMTIPFSQNVQYHDIILPRIDLNDVLVTQEDGTKYYAKGRYDLYLKNNFAKTSNEQWHYILPVQSLDFNSLVNNKIAVSNGSFITGHGLSVVPGEYKIIVKYDNGEGPQTQEYITNLK